MSFISDIVDFASGAIDYLSGSGIGSIASTALLGYGLYQLNNNVSAENATPTTAQPSNNPINNPIPDAGVRLQVNPDVEHKIPVVYGNCQLGGIITDVEMANGNQLMYVCFTLCERTGVKLSDGSQSVISFNNIYINDQRCIFADDGVTLAYTLDRDGVADSSLNGLVQIYCYNNGSLNGVYPIGYTGPGITHADNIMPSWSPYHRMSDLVFAIVKLQYNAQRGLQKIPTMRFHLSNSMQQAGDCLYDYITNTRYGAGVDPQEVYGA